MKKRLWEFFDFYFANKKLEIDFSSYKKCFLSVLYQKRFKRERKMRSKMQDQMESELRKRSQIEEILKASNAPEAALRILAGKYIILVSWKWAYEYLMLLTFHSPLEMDFFLLQQFLPRSCQNSSLNARDDMAVKGWKLF